MQQIDNHIYKDVLELSNMGILLYRGGHIIYVNKQFETIVEEKLDISKDITLYDYLKERYHEQVKELIRKVEEGGENWINGDYPIVLKNGKHKYIKSSAKLIDEKTKTILVEITDITALKQKEEEDEKYKFNLENIIDEAPINILIINELGVIKFFNKYETKKNVGIQENFVGKNLNDFLEYQKSDSVLNRIYFGFKNKVNLNEIIEFKVHNSTSRWFELKMKYIKGNELNNNSFIALVQDVTDIKLMELKIKNFNEDLKRKVHENIATLEAKTKKIERGQEAMVLLLEDMKDVQSELKAANKKMKIMNDDLESFNFSVSHDLKSPLRVISNYAKFLSEDLANKIDDDSLTMVAEIERQGNIMNQLLNDLLYFSRYGSARLNKVVVDMKELVAAIFSEEFRDKPYAEKFNITIEPLPNIFADYALIKQVIINLVSNAVKFTKHKDNPQILVGFIENKEEITYFFKDNGAGFNDNRSKQIFELFHKLNKTNNESGTGIGLAIVKRIVEKHGGKVYAKGVDGFGAEIGFSLPKNNLK